MRDRVHPSVGKARLTAATGSVGLIQSEVDTAGVPGVRRLPEIIVTAVLGVLLVGVVATAFVVGGSPPSAADAPAAPAQPAAPTSPAPAQPAAPTSEAPAQPAALSTVTFFGDGYTSGSPAGGQGLANYTSLLASPDRWQVVTNESVYGSGYVADPALQTRLQKVVAANPQLVVVTAGRADDLSDPAAVGAAATRLYQELRTQLPRAKVVVIGPMWLGEDPEPRMLPVRDAIRGATTGAGLPFVDPIADRWFNGSDGGGIAPGGEIPNDEGHQRLAQLVDDALKRSGALPG